MLNRSLILIFLLSSITVFSQAPKKVGKVTEKEIYDVLKVVIDTQKLNKQFGLNETPEKDFDFDEPDSVYFEKLAAFKNPPPDTSTSGIDAPIVFYPAYPEENIISSSDVDHLLKTKKKFKDFHWNNRKLGFDENNKRNYYTFSVPLFNRRHDRVFVTYTYRCPGLCGTDVMLLLTKIKYNWKVDIISIASH